MFELLIAAGFAVFIWWFSTGIVILLDRLPRTTFRWSIVISTLLALLSLWGIAASARHDTVASAYCGFTCALLVWGWHELSFLTGWLTGPRKGPATPGAKIGTRFSQATAVILWHEFAIIIVALFIVALTRNEPNQAGTWTFLVLWVMRTSAKLNLFLGVRNLSEEFLPAHLRYLASYFTRRPMNLLFPLAVAGATAVAVLMVQAAFAASSASQAAGLMLAATMLWLAIVEHWLLVLPLPASALWRWALKHAEDDAAAPAAEALAHAR